MEAMSGVNVIIRSCLIAASCTAIANAADVVSWYTDIGAARQASAQQHKPLLVHFWAPDCLPCRIVDRDVFSQAAVGQALESLYVPVKLNAREASGLASELGVDRWPMDVIVGLNGQVISRMVSPQNPEQYIARITQVSNQQQVQRTATETNPASWSTTSAQAPWPPQQVRAPLGVPESGPAAPPTAGPGVAQSSPSPQHSIAQHQPPSAPQEIVNPYVRPRAEHAMATQAGPAASVYGGASGRMAYDQNRVADAAPPVNPPSVAQQPTYNAPAAPEYGYAAQQAAPSGPATEYPQPAHGHAPQAGYEPTPSGYEPTKAAHAYAPASDPAGYAAAGPIPHPGATAGVEQTTSPPAKPPVGLDGFCAVTLADEQKWSEGDPKWGAIHRGKLYLFSSEKHRQRFMANPDSFSPMLAGYDPVAFVEHGKAVEGKRAHGVVFNDQVFLFSGEETLKQFWNSPHRYEGLVLQAMQGGTRGQVWR